MIFSKELLYLHLPKTAGMSISDLLLKALSPPVYYSHPESEPRWDGAGITDIPGIRHENLAEARAAVARYGFSLEEFPLILVVVRNPYAIEVSRYGYYQKGHAWDAHHPGRDLAMSGDFRGFAVETTPHGGRDRPMESYLLEDGVQPRNLRVGRYENLRDDLCALLRSVGVDISAYSLPTLNQSTHGDWKTYYDSVSEAAVYERYRWMFEAGFYERLALDRREAPC